MLQYRRAFRSPMKCSIASVSLLVIICLQDAASAVEMRAYHRLDAVVAEKPDVSLSRMAETKKNTTVIATLPPKAFMLQCCAHVQELIHKIDRTHTDMQIEATLEQECELEHMFPNVAEDGFNEKESCQRFATKLHRARHAELDSGSTEGYVAFCRDYYFHKNPVKMEMEAPAPAQIEAPFVYWKLIIFSALAVVFVAVGGKAQK
eukprot:TRINITY_DN6593_c0_g2_i1.p1 TRINITY_DN6593_c0_g2~~TRINITY_DN6593_c0_g2_i1.p1  ORF type:complete len:205 (+),score=35.86 TRINITY_DN6593_c0_g2_i1:35-649(+)